MEKILITHLLYHKNCADGFAAALTCWMNYGKDVEYIPVFHEQELPDLPQNAEVVMVDISFPREKLLKFKESITSLIVLDHHVSAQKDIGDLDFTIFDMNKSGATLAWRYFHPNAPTPSFFQYIQDRDLWTWQLPQSREFSAGLDIHEHDFRTWLQFVVGARAIDRIIREGEILIKLKNQLVDENCKLVRIVRVDGYDIPIVNCSLKKLASDVGHKLCEEHEDSPFSASYVYDEDGNMRVSLRSIGDFDVSEVAKKFGGGGHKNAAGMVLLLNYSIDKCMSCDKNILFDMDKEWGYCNDDCKERWTANEN